jgi:hypothetical protein
MSVSLAALRLLLVAVRARTLVATAPGARQADHDWILLG